MYHRSATQWSNLYYQGLIMELKLNNNCIFLPFLYFFHYSIEISPNPTFFLFTDKKCNIFYSLTKLCKIKSDFNLILRNKITVGANRKFFTLTQNDLKVIDANQKNQVESSLVITIPTSVRTIMSVYKLWLSAPVFHTATFKEVHYLWLTLQIVKGMDK